MLSSSRVMRGVVKIPKNITFTGTTKNYFYLATRNQVHVDYARRNRILKRLYHRLPRETKELIYKRGLREKYFKAQSKMTPEFISARINGDKPRKTSVTIGKSKYTAFVKAEFPKLTGSSKEKIKKISEMWRKQHQQ